MGMFGVGGTASKLIKRVTSKVGEMQKPSSVTTKPVTAPRKPVAARKEYSNPFKNRKPAAAVPARKAKQARRGSRASIISGYKGRRAAAATKRTANATAELAKSAPKAVAETKASPKAKGVFKDKAKKFSKNRGRMARGRTGGGFAGAAKRAASKFRGGKTGYRNKSGFGGAIKRAIGKKKMPYSTMPIKRKSNLSLMKKTGIAASRMGSFR